MKRIKQLIKNLIFLSGCDLKNELKPTVNIKDLTTRTRLTKNP